MIYNVVRLFFFVCPLKSLTPEPICFFCFMKASQMAKGCLKLYHFLLEMVLGYFSTLPVIVLKTKPIVIIMYNMYV